MGDVIEFPRQSSRPRQRCVARLRRASGLTQEQLAEYVGATVDDVQSWEDGAAVPDQEAAVMASLFGVSLSYLHGLD